MNAETFYEHFATFAEAPNGVAKLREMILQLAVQGKLVPQDPNDEPARDLLKRIQRDELLNVKQRLSHGEIDDLNDTDDLPSVLPSNWVWTRLGSIMAFTNGFAFQSNDYQNDGVGIVRIGDIQNGDILDCDMKRISESFLTSLDPKFRVNPGDLVIAMSGATTGKLGFNRTPTTFLLNQRVGKLQFIQINPQFAYFYLGTKIQENLRISAGSAIPNLSTEQIKAIWFPLPPLAEQKRIVEKVDQLLGLCDELESRQAVRREARSRLVGATLDRLVSPSSAAEFPKNVNRVRDQFDRFFDTPTTIPQLRQTILQLAVQGKLVPQDPNDRSVSIGDGQLAANSENEQIPPKWLPVTIRQLLPEFQNGESSRGASDGVPTIVLRLADISNRKITLSDTRRILLPEQSSIKYGLQKGDCLIVRVNGSADLVGRIILCRDENITAIYCDHFIRMRIDKNLVAPEFLEVVGNSPEFRRQISRSFVTTAGQKTVNQNHISSIAFLLPPLAEQKRIVEKVDQLMKLCDALEANLIKAETKSSELLNAAVHQLLNPTSSV